MSGSMVSLKTGLAYSINRVTAYLMKQVGPELVIDLARRMGVESPMKPVPSICLGSMDMSVVETGGLMADFANLGAFMPNLWLFCVSRIKMERYPKLYHHQSRSHERQVAYAMVSMLKGVVDFVTAKRIRSTYGLRGEIAGKTGTTNDNSDGWFIGVVPRICGRVWGWWRRKSIRFRSTALGSGSNMALPIWAKFMRRIQQQSHFHYPKRPLY